MADDKSASLQDRAFVPPASSPAGSPVPASIPSAAFLPIWTEWRVATPEVGRKFIVAHDDGCSAGIYVMLDDGPHDAEDGENYGVDPGALWALLPDSYPIHFMEITEEDWR